MEIRFIYNIYNCLPYPGAITGLPLSLATDEEILLNTKKLFEEAIEPYYRRFKQKMITGLGLIVLGVLLAAINVAAAIAISSMGVILVAFALLQRTKIESFNLVSYPVAVASLEQSSYIIDARERLGDRLEIEIPKIDTLLKPVSQKLSLLNNVLAQSSGDEAKAVIIVRDESGEKLLLTRTEQEARQALQELSNIIDSIPRDKLSVSLVRPLGQKLRVRDSRYLEESLYLLNPEEVKQQAIGAAKRLKEALSLSHESFVRNIREDLNKLRSRLDDYYAGLHDEITIIDSLLALNIKKIYDYFCPKCFTEMLSNVFLTGEYPRLVRIHAAGGIEVYRCPRCGKTYTNSLREEHPPVIRMLRFEPTYAKAWSFLYMTRLDEINKYVARARRDKSEVIERATTELLRAQREFLTSISPLLVRAIEAYEVARASLASISMLSRAGIHPPCSPGEELEELAKTINALRERVLGAEINKIIRSIRNRAKPRIDRIFLNEVMLERLAKAYKLIGMEDKSQQVLRIMKEGDFDDFLELIEKT